MLYERYQNCRLIVDLNHLAHRHWSTSTLTTSLGVPTGAIFGPLKTVLQLTGLFHPKQVIAVRDTNNTFRRAFFPQYKETRLDVNRTIEEKAERKIFHDQLNGLEEILLNLGVPVLGMSELEADDLAAIVAHAIPFDGETILVSGDKDYIQLVREGCSLFSPMLPVNGKLLSWSGPEDLTDDKTVWIKMREVGPRTFTKWLEKVPSGIPLERWLLYRLLTGDSSDCLPGVSGIGSAAAFKLIQRFYSLEVLKEAGIDEWSKCLSKRQADSLNESIRTNDLDLQYKCIDLSFVVDSAKEDKTTLNDLQEEIERATTNEAKARALILQYEMSSFLMDWKNFLNHFPAFRL